MDYIWNITGKCNLNCAYCWDVFKNTNEIDTAQAKQIIRDITVLQPCDMLLFTGGEPLLRADLFELIHYGKEKGVQHIKICTNGILLERRIEEIKYAPISEIHISVDSVEDKQGGLRGQSQLVLKNIDILLKHIDVQHCKIVLVSVINYDKLDEFEKVLRYAKKRNVYVTYQLPVTVPNSEGLSLMLDYVAKEKLINLFSKLQEFHRIYRSQLDYFSYFYFLTAKDYYLNGVVPPKCQAGEAFKIISPDGQLYDCYSCKNKPFSIHKCFNSKCLVWFRSNQRAHRIFQLLQSYPNIDS